MGSGQLAAAQQPLSLATPIGESGEGETALLELLEDEQAPLPAAETERLLRRSDLTLVLTMLPSRERLIIELRYGLAGELPRTLRQVGSRLGVTSERVRQIQAKSLVKLRAFRPAQALRGFLEVG